MRWVGIFLMLLVCVSTVVAGPLDSSSDDNDDGPDWSDSDSFTSDNVAADTEGAIAADSERAFNANPGAVMDHLSGGSVSWVGDGAGITCANGGITNTMGPTLDNLGQYPAGTTISPDGTDGFKISLPGAEALLKGQDITGVTYADGKLGMKIGAETVQIENPGKVEVNGKDIKLEKGAKVSFDGVKVIAKGDTTIKTGKGYEIHGKFQAHFDTPIGTVSVPSVLESTASELVDTGAITLHINTGKTMSDAERMVIWDGSDMIAQGKITSSIMKGDEMVQVGGALDGVVYKYNDEGMTILSNPSSNTMRDAIIKDIKEKREELEEKLNGQVKRKIKDLESLSELTAAQEKELKILEYQEDVLKEKLADLPKYKQINLNDRSSDSSVGLYEGYNINALNKYPVELVGVVNAKGNVIYGSVVNYVAGKKEYEIKSSKGNLFTDSVVEGGQALSYDFSIVKEGKELRKWSLQDGNIYNVKQNFFGSGETLKEVDFYGDINLNVKNNKVTISGDMTRTFTELTRASGGLVGLFGPSVVKDAFEGVELTFMDMEVSGNSITIRQDLDQELDRIDSDTIKNTFLEKGAKTIKDEAYTTDDIKMITGAVDSLADQHILSTEAVDVIKKGLTESFHEVKESDDFFNLQAYHGMEITYTQVDDNNGRIEVVIKGSPKDIPISAKSIITEDMNIPNEVRKNLEIVSKSRNVVEVYEKFLKAIPQ